MLLVIYGTEWLITAEWLVMYCYPSR